MPGRSRRPRWADPQSQSWAQLVRCYEEVPSLYRGFFDGLPVREREPFPYTVLTPTFKGVYRRPERERLVCSTGGHIHVLEKTDDGFLSTSYRPDAIACVETGTILLHSWITIHGLCEDEAFHSTTLIFNSISDTMMAPFIERLRSATLGGKNEDVSAEGAKFGWLAEENFKFMNYAERSILPAERVLQNIYQRQIRHEPLGFRGLSLARSILPAHLCILTTAELILLTDDESQRWLHGSPHGAIWRYIPLKEISSARISIRGDHICALSIGITGGLQFEPLFEACKEAELELLLQQLRK